MAVYSDPRSRKESMVEMLKEIKSIKLSDRRNFDGHYWNQKFQDRGFPSHIKTFFQNKVVNHLKHLKSLKAAGADAPTPAKVSKAGPSQKGCLLYTSPSPRD